MIGVTIALVVAVFWLAWSNGANDNFKGVATLYGSDATWLIVVSGAGANHHVAGVYHARFLRVHFRHWTGQPPDAVEDRRADRRDLADHAATRRRAGRRVVLGQPARP